MTVRSIGQLFMYFNKNSCKKAKTLSKMTSSIGKPSACGAPRLDKIKEFDNLIFTES